jgi:hypothetical protein
MAALRAGLQQQLTPSCCTQLAQRLAPAYWAVVRAQQVPQGDEEVIMLSGRDGPAHHMATWLQAVRDLTDWYEAGGPPCWAPGEALLLLLQWVRGMRQGMRPAQEWGGRPRGCRGCISRDPDLQIWSGASTPRRFQSQVTQAYPVSTVCCLAPLLCGYR